MNQNLLIKVDAMCNIKSNIIFLLRFFGYTLYVILSHNTS